MQKYESKQHQILLPAEQIYTLISSFENLTPALAGKVEEWEATPERCSFKAKGFKVRLKMEERISPKHVKVVADEGSGIPMDFAFWIQLHSASPYDTRFRLVLHAELNTMMKMMIGGKIQSGLDQMAESVAGAFAQQTGRV
ncbi:MAG: polyketide cyclase [Rikenellaceae bacterium]